MKFKLIIAMVKTGNTDRIVDGIGDGSRHGWRRNLADAQRWLIRSAD